MYKSAITLFDEAIAKNSEAMSVSNRVERLEALERSSLLLSKVIKYKEECWKVLLLCTIGEKGIAERKAREEEWEELLSCSRKEDEVFWESWEKIKKEYPEEHRKKWDELCRQHGYDDDIGEED